MATSSSSTKQAAAPAETEYVVTFDVFTWVMPRPGKPGEVDHFRAFLGDRVKLVQDVADRALGLGAVALPDDAPDMRRQVEALAGPVSDDSELADMTAAELIAYVGQHPDEASRVAAFEAANQARPNVLKATGVQEGGATQPAAGGTGVTHNG